MTPDEPIDTKPTQPTKDTPADAALKEQLARLFGCQAEVLPSEQTEKARLPSPSFPPDASGLPSPGLPQVPGYEVLEVLGRGGMGVVYKARHLKLNRLVALKMILHSAYASEEVCARFLREAESIAAIKHDGVVQVYDFGMCQGAPYFALEFCDGGSLHHLLSGKPLPSRDAAILVEQIARAVGAAHAQGIVHRDLKPANVLLSHRPDATPVAEGAGETQVEQLTAKVTDFGLARRLDASDALTQTNAVMGTPSYMAPEQAVATKKAGPSADIYAVGAILYECLTGRAPFVAATSFETLRLVVSSEPPTLHSLNPNTPPDLETICLKCLRKVPEHRYDSADALADDLRRWTTGVPILARPAGLVERAVKWVRRNAVVSALLACVLLVFATGTAVSLVFAFVAKSSLQKADDEQRKRALAQIDALVGAAPGEVRVILAVLDHRREDVLPHVRTRYVNEHVLAKKARLALALLPDEPALVRAEVAEAMMTAEDPAELVLLRDVLIPYADGLSEELWTRVGDGKGKGFRALVALAAFDAKNVRWKQHAPKLVERLLGENPLHMGVWVEALQPIRGHLVEPLAVVFRDDAPERASARVEAAEVLGRYVGDQPGVLQELLLDADGKQFALLRPHIEKHRERIVEHMHAELGKPPDYWKDQPLKSEWKLDEKTKGEIESASGIVAERWAMCQSLPMERIEAVTQAMGAAGYRPVSVRPHRSAGVPPASRIAIVWTRDTREWKLEQDLTFGALTQHDAAQQKAGFVPTDVSAYTTKDGVRYLGLWRLADKGESAVLFADVPEEKMRAETTARSADSLVPLRVSSFNNEKGATHFSGVWAIGKDTEANLSWTDDEGKHAGHVADADRLLRDVDLRQSGATRRYASVWSGDSTRQAESLQGLSPEAHLARCRDLASLQYRPVALSLTSVPDEKLPLAASVWHRPVVLSETVTLARRRANAAATLLALQRPEKAWPLFKHLPDPTSRSWLVWRAGEFGSDPRQLIFRLEAEQDISARRAILLALGEYTEQELPAEVRVPLVKKLLAWYRDDPDPGVHSAISWLMRHSHEGPAPRPLDWGQAKQLEAIDNELSQPESRAQMLKAGASWYVNGQGHTMVLVKGPVDFAMGSRLWDPERFAGNDRPHMRRIPRSFEIASTVVTVAQWERFLKDRPERRFAYPKRYSPEEQGPMISVTWYDAAAYCNWLSEKEAIPKEQWCYPKEIGPGMKMPEDYLRRTGYRLPTEAELDFACKAGADNSRHFGSEMSLLSRYAHFQANSKHRTWPVGQKRPNDLGLFDTLGNVWNWTQNPFHTYPPRLSATMPVDTEESSDVVTGVDLGTGRALRGGSFFLIAPLVRSSRRLEDRPGARNLDFGLRVSRTSRLEP